MKAVFWRFAEVVFAYGAAVVVSGIFYPITVLFSVVIRKSSNSLEILGALPMLYLFGLIGVAILALPGWLLSVGIAEYLSERRKAYYLAVGILNALLVPAAVSQGEITSMVKSNWIAFSSILFVLAVSGLVGGWTYWRVAGYNSGQWRASC